MVTVTEFDPLPAINWGEYLAGLSTEERAQARSVAKTALVNSIPDDEVGKPPVRTLGEYLDDPIELPPMLVEPGIVARGAITAMTARGGKGKTAVSLNRVVRWSMGKPLFDALPDVLVPADNRPLRTLIIENEGAPGHFQFVIKTILERNGFTDEEKSLARANVLIWGDGGWSSLKLDDPENVAMVDRALASTRPDMVFIEPMRGLWKGDENSSTEMHVLLDNLSALANDYDLGVLLTHHERKSGAESGEDPMSAARGSGVLEGHAAVMERWLPRKGDRQRELSWTKSRFREAPAPIRMQFERDSWSYRYIAEDETDRVVIQALQGAGTWISVKELAEEIEETVDTTRRRVLKLVKDERVDRRTIPGEGHVFRIKGSNGVDGALALT